MIAKDCPANYQARRITANVAKLPEGPDHGGCNDAQNIAVRFDGSDGHCLCGLYLWDGSRI